MGEAPKIHMLHSWLLRWAFLFGVGSSLIEAAIEKVIAFPSFFQFVMIAH